VSTSAMLDFEWCPDLLHPLGVERFKTFSCTGSDLVLSFSTDGFVADVRTSAIPFPVHLLHSRKLK
jgi:hypothetical protein